MERRGAAVLLTVDRPEARNAVDEAVHAGLAAGLDEAEGSDARGIVITGAGSSFVSGGDLKLIRREPFDATLAFCERMRALLDRFEASALPVFAAVNGHAMGGGCEVLVACDQRVCAPSAKLSFRQAAMGVSTGWGAAARLARLVPRSVAARLLLEGEVLDARAAHALGLVDELADDPLTRCLERVEALAAHPAAAVAGLKRVLHAAYSEPERARAVEADTFAELWGGEAHQAALEAYFRGRSED